MKIGILSLILNTNYGGILQSYALQTVLERMGHQVKLIDRQFIPEIAIRERFLDVPKRFIQRYLFRRTIDVFPPQHYAHLQYVEKSTETRNFIFRHIKIYHCKTLNRISPKTFDTIVVGSDQVWRPAYFSCWGNIQDAFLNFAKKWNIRRISYAASFGTDECEYSTKQMSEISHLIQLFDAISVREESGKVLCKKLFNAEASFVLDPTLLLERQEYERLIESRETPAIDGTLLNYILDDNRETDKLIHRVSEDKGLIPFRINDSESLASNVRRKPVEYWLKAFRDAEFIVTDSFHACVFSVIFHKPFICIGNKSRGLSRFQLFTEKLGMRYNIITSVEDYSPARNYAPTESVYQKLMYLREQSEGFLKTSLT